MSSTKSPRIANQLLAALPKKDYQALQHHLEEIPLVFEEILYQPNVLISDVYFPNSGIVSLLAAVNGALHLRWVWSAKRAYLVWLFSWALALRIIARWFRASAQP